MPRVRRLHCEVPTLELLAATLPELRRGLSEAAARTIADEVFEKPGLGAVAVTDAPEVEVVGEAAGAAEALALAKAARYDVVFLDVEMPGITGLEAAPLVHDRAERPELVFVTTAASS